MTKELMPVEKMKYALDTPLIKEQLSNALGKNASVFRASLIDAFVGGLQTYEPYNIIEEAMKAAVLNLPIAKSLGFAYLIPYKGKIQFQIGYKGLIQLAERSGQVKRINEGEIYEGELRETDKMRGLFDFNGEKKSDKVIGYFAYLELVNGFEKVIYWTREQVVAHAQKYSKSYNNSSSAWKTNFDAMAKKTLLRALFSKYAPMTVDFQQALTFDQDESIDITRDASHTPAVPTPEPKAPPVPDESLTASQAGIVNKKNESLVEEVETLREMKDSDEWSPVIARLQEQKTLKATAIFEALRDNDADACQSIIELLEQSR